jgi:transcriptional regulator with XRE-family HTH domain
VGSSETRPIAPLRKARKDADMRQADVAEKAGVSISYVSMIEAGLVPPVAVQERVALAVSSTPGALWP